MDTKCWAVALSLIGGVLAAACGSAQWSPGETRPIGEEQGWIVLGFEATRAVSHVELCAQKSGTCVGAGPFRSVDEIAVLVVDRGRWCVSRILTEQAASGGTIHPGTGSMCVTAVSGRTRYPGHFALHWQGSSTATELVSVSLVDHSARVETIRARDYPGVAPLQPPTR